MVTPVSGNNSSIPISTASSVNANTTLTAAASDTLQTSSTSHMSIVQYLADVGTPLLQAQQVYRSNTTDVFLNSKDLFTSLATEAQVYQKLVQQAEDHDTLVQQMIDQADQINTTDLTALNDPTKSANDNTQITNLNTAAANYQTAVADYQLKKAVLDTLPSNATQSQIDTATNDFNTAASNLQTAATAYNQAASDYQTYYDTREPDYDVYNLDVDTYNALLTNVPDLNNTRSLFNLPPINPSSASTENLPAPPPLLTSTTVPVDTLPAQISFSSPPYPQLDTSSLSLIGNATPDNPIFAQSITSISTLAQIYALTLTSTPYTQETDNLYGIDKKLLGLPLALTTPFPDVHAENNPGGVGASGINLNSYLTPFNLSNPKLLRSTAQSVNTQQMQSTTRSLVSGENATNTSNAITSKVVPQLVAYNAYASVLPAISQFNAFPPIPAGNKEAVIQGLIALGTVRNLLDNIQNGSLSQQAAETLSGLLKGQGLSDEEQSAILQSSAASFSANLLNASLIVLSQNLKLPNLPGQFYAQVLRDLQVPEEQIAAITSPANATTTEVLANPLTAVASKQDLLHPAKELGLTENQAVPVINNAIGNTLLNGPVSTESDLKTSNYANFRNQGLSSSQALVLSYEHSRYVAAEKATPLSTPIPANTLSPNVLLEAVQKEIPNLQNQETVNNALNATLRLNIPTLRDFRTTFIREQTERGIDLTTARNNAEPAVASAFQQITPAAPPFKPENVQQDVLIASLAGALNRSEELFNQQTRQAGLARAAEVQTEPLVTAPQTVVPPLPQVTAPQTVVPPLPQVTAPQTAVPQVAASARETVVSPAEQTARRIVQAAFTAQPPPATAADLRAEIRTRLINEGLPLQNARAIAEHALIATAPLTPAPQNLQNIRTQFSDRIEQLTGQKNDQMADDFLRTLLGNEHSVRTHLKENISTLNQYSSQRKQELAPQLTEPIHKQVLESLYKEAIAYDSTTAPALVTSAFIAHPMFGMPKESIDFPKEQRA